MGHLPQDLLSFPIVQLITQKMALMKIMVFKLHCAMEDVILREGADTVGAVVVEPITAGGGVIVPPEGYFQEIRRICDKYDILLHMDEVVCGLGRTAELGLVISILISCLT